MTSNEPDFETKAADIIGPYLDPPRHAAVSASTRRPQSRRLTGGTACCRFRRDGSSATASSTSATARCRATRFECANGRGSGNTTARHTSLGFIGFLGEVVATCVADEEIHVILGNLPTHKTKLLEAFLDEHPNVTLHFTPTYSESPETGVGGVGSSSNCRPSQETPAFAASAAPPDPHVKSPRADCSSRVRREVVDGRDAPVQAGPQGPQRLSERRDGRRVIRRTGAQRRTRAAR